MIETFLDEVRWSLRDILNDMEDDFVKDSTGYVYVDGEEGDHGDITYSDGGNLIATHRIYGGDQDEYFFTEHGCSLLFKKIAEALPLSAKSIIREAPVDVCDTLQCWEEVK
jgi:hypothetical protein